MNRLHNADSAHAITMLQQSKYDSKFIVCGEVIIWVAVIEDEGKGRRMRQQVSDWCPICAEEGKTEEGCRLEYEVPPSSANLYKLIPPTLVIPFPSSQDFNSVFLLFV